MGRYDFEELKNTCSGQWESIIRALSMVDISDAIAKRGKHVQCHRNHGTTRQQFRVFPDFDQTGGGVCNTCGTFADGFKLLDYLNGWANAQAVKEVAEYLRNRGYAPQRHTTPPPPPPKKTFDVNEDNLASLEKVWKGSQSLRGTLGEKYLRDRGITGWMPNTNDVRFHPNLHYWDDDNEQSMGFFPAIVSLLRSSKAGHPLSIHRIYLDPNGGKAKVPKTKKLMSCSIPGAISELGAAIRMYKLSGFSMAITEGIETAAAINAAHPGIGVWAAYSAQVLTNFRPPPSIKIVFIFGDLDASGTGQVASARLALKLEADGYKARICLPGDSVSLPDATSGWYTKDAPQDKIVKRLEKDGYGIVDACESMDWLDAWNQSPSSLKNALARRNAA